MMRQRYAQLIGTVLPAVVGAVILAVRLEQVRCLSQDSWQASRDIVSRPQNELVRTSRVVVTAAVVEGRPSYQGGRNPRAVTPGQGR
jgi:hypothetical protein